MSQKQLRIWAILVGVVSGWILSQYALPYSPPEASGWWQVVLVIVGLPILLDQLKKIQEEAKKAQWKPEISIGLAPFPLSISDLEVGKDLPTELHVVRQSSNFRLTLVIQNRGKLAAKFVKILLVKSFEENAYMPRVAIQWGQVTNEKRFGQVGNKEYVFNGGIDWVLYPHDIEQFRVVLSPIGDSIKADDYYFHCTVWAEGLDNPVSELLVIKINE